MRLMKYSLKQVRGMFGSVSPTRDRVSTTHVDSALNRSVGVGDNQEFILDYGTEDMERTLDHSSRQARRSTLTKWSF